MTDDFKTIHDKLHGCSNCHKLFNVVAGGDEPPKTNDVTVCSGCLSVLIFKEDGHTRLPEEGELDEDDWESVEFARDVIRWGG